MRCPEGPHLSAKSFYNENLIWNGVGFARTSVNFDMKMGEGYGLTLIENFYTDRGVAQNGPVPYVLIERVGALCGPTRSEYFAWKGRATLSPFNLIDLFSFINILLWRYIIICRLCEGYILNNIHNGNPLFKFSSPSFWLCISFRGESIGEVLFGHQGRPCCTHNNWVSMAGNRRERLPRFHAVKFSNRVRSPQEDNLMGSCLRGSHKKQYGEECRKKAPADLWREAFDSFAIPAKNKRRGVAVKAPAKKIKEGKASVANPDEILRKGRTRYVAPNKFEVIIKRGGPASWPPVYWNDKKGEDPLRGPPQVWV